MPPLWERLRDMVRSMREVGVDFTFAWLEAVVATMIDVALLAVPVAILYLIWRAVT